MVGNLNPLFIDTIIKPGENFQTFFRFGITDDFDLHSSSIQSTRLADYKHIASQRCLPVVEHLGKASSRLSREAFANRSLAVDEGLWMGGFP